MAIELTGKVSGSVRELNDAQLNAVWQASLVTYPTQDDSAESTLIEMDSGKLSGTYPVVLFAHGSSGINPAIREFCLRVSKEQQVVCVVPDSMATADRLTYTSPVSRDDYEAIHAMRSAELAYAAQALAKKPWFDGRVIVAGTSEGGVTAARFVVPQGSIKLSGKMIFSWSCEENYFVQEPGNALPDDLPVLHVMSLEDKFFGRGNSYLDNPKAVGCASEALKNNASSQIVLLPKAPHTLLNLPQTVDAVASFIKRLWHTV